MKARRTQKTTWLFRCFLCVLCVVGVASDNQGKEAELIAFWDHSDEANTSLIDHSVWQAILDEYLDAAHVSGISRFDYAALKSNPADVKRLVDYVISLSEVDPRTLRRVEQKPYWINFYNALTVYVVTNNYPVESIRDIKSGLLTFGPWEKTLVTVQGQEVTLDNIEHGILRPIFSDPRIHYAVNCASLGCPNLAAEVYTSLNTDALLESGARAYVNHPRGASIVDGELLVSSIYDWFKLDFGGTDAGVIAHLKQYAEPELASALDGFKSFDDEYDWNLNQP